MTPSEIAPLERVGAGAQAIRLVELEEAVDLVGEEVDAGAGERRRSARPTPRRSAASRSGCAGALTTTSRVAGRERRRAARSTSSAQPSASWSSCRRDVRAGRAGHLVQALVAGPGHDRVVARAERATFTRQKIASSAPANTRTSSASMPSYSAGDLAPQERVAGRLGVAEGQAVPQGARLVVGQGQQLGHRHSPRRPRRTGGARPRTPSGRSTARARSRRCASAHDAGTIAGVLAA